MPYVNVPNDLSKIKTKIAFNLTKRQLICFGIGAAVGIPTYLLTRSAIGNTGALFVMLGIMPPAFMMAMYEKDGLPFEKVRLPAAGLSLLYAGEILDGSLLPLLPGGCSAHRSGAGGRPAHRWPRPENPALPGLRQGFPPGWPHTVLLRGLRLGRKA